MSVPIGCIMAWGGHKDNIPDNWLLCDGSRMDRGGDDQLYHDLHEAIFQAWGGTGPQDFNLPDMRGYFLRGVSDGSGHDPDAGTRTAVAAGGIPGDHVGTFQEDAFKSHTHVYSVPAENVEI